MKKVFILHGQGAPSNTNNNTSYALNKKFLSKYVKVVEFGDPSQGLSLFTLPLYFGEKITVQDDRVNVILKMHGNVNEDGSYYLAPRSKDKILATDLLQQIKDATGGLPLNILNIACYGANIHDGLDTLQLPEGSKVLSISTNELLTDNCNFLNPRLGKLAEIVFKDGFNFEKLVEITSATSTYGLFAPVISEVKNGTVHTTDIAKFLSTNIDKIDAKIADSTVLAHLASKNLICKEYKELVSSIAHGDKLLEDFVCPQDLVLKLIEACESGNLSEYIQNFEGKYCPALGFTEEHFAKITEKVETIHAAIKRHGVITSKIAKLIKIEEKCQALNIIANPTKEEHDERCGLNDLLFSENKKYQTELKDLSNTHSKAMSELKNLKQPLLSMRIDDVRSLYAQFVTLGHSHFDSDILRSKEPDYFGTLMVTAMDAFISGGDEWFIS